MKALIGVAVVVVLALGAWHLFEYWTQVRDQNDGPAPSRPAVVMADSGEQLPGLPPKLAPVLDEALKRGAPGLKEFLSQYGKSVSDPRLAWIELDYVILLAPSSPGAARKEFALVKSRVTPDSPVYGRVQQLAKTYD